MTARTLSERVLDAVAALVRDVRTANGYITEAGADVRVGEDAVALQSATHWLTTVSTISETPRASGGGRVVRAVRRYELDHTVAVEAYARFDDVGAERQLLRLSADLRQVLATSDGALTDSTGRLGVIELVNCEPIRDHVPAGHVGLRVSINVTRIEAWGNPAVAL